jgi:hypothetical protein
MGNREIQVACELANELHFVCNRDDLAALCSIFVPNKEITCADSDGVSARYKDGAIIYRREN